MVRGHNDAQRGREHFSPRFRNGYGFRRSEKFERYCTQRANDSWLNNSKLFFEQKIRTDAAFQRCWFTVARWPTFYDA